MLKSLSLTNFRGFSEHRIEFCPETILVGQNNAGKTTIIEALRILSICQARAQSATLTSCPPWLDNFCQGAGFRFSLEIIDFDFTNVQQSYDTDRPAVIRAKMTNNNEVHVYVGNGPEQLFCQLRIGANRIVHSRADITPRKFGAIKVMPPIGSLLPHEKRIAKERLSRYLDGYLAYRHFRNQLWERPSDYRLFQSLLEDTWYGLKLGSFDNDHGKERNEFALMVREGRFASEIAWHGHGLQAWMQTLWFLARAPKDMTVVLDEPDIYLHADLQRKLIKVIESLKFKQAVIATHSTEIISDVPFQNVVVVQKRNRISKSAENAPQIQQALRSLGSLHSIQLSKLATKGVVLWVEGDDRRYLSEVAFKLGPRQFDRFTQLAIHEVNGKDNWVRVLGAAQALNQVLGGEIGAVLLLDRDYMLDKQVEDIEIRCKDGNLSLKLWEKKEIENYFLCAPAIARIICSHTEANIVETVAKIELMMTSVEAEILEDTILSFSDVIQHSSNPKIEGKTAFKRAKTLVEERLQKGEQLRDIAAGKGIFSRLSDKCKRELGISFSALAICKEMKVAEYPDEIKRFVDYLCGLTKP